MSSSDEESRTSSPPEPPQQVVEIGEPDQDTLRIMLSTDNHLGYCERDPVRGLDSFAAFEEVLVLAREKQCDMVLIAGDLFHENKPSRRTMYKTMEIIRRYCMGPNDVQIRIVSNQASSFRSVHGKVNYEDENYAVDLPLFSIHGNHDDPTRDGGTEMLAALDLLAVSNLVNYFGRQDEVDKVEVSPVLMQKGSTRVAMYGMGSMRDERLNRMWQGKKVRFLRPDQDEEESDDEEEESTPPWFNIFALHQNRDLGRGVKNCVHESMIPEWMDLVVWGHEHECRIDPQESVVGTFRITQPGSSVATSLTGGEAVRKHVGILDIKGNQFRLASIPLTQIRSFVMGQTSLSDHKHDLDIEDPKIDTKVAKVLDDEVDLLVYQAQEKTKELHRDALAFGNTAGDERNPHQLQYRLQKPEEVLVRLKVEHSGFSTLNNQRFGAKFVGRVANPSDVLLFHRKRQEGAKKQGGKKKNADALNEPIAPTQLEEMDIEDLARRELEGADKSLELLNQQKLGLALDDFVVKEQKLAMKDIFSDMLKKQQYKLIRRGSEGTKAVRETLAEEAEREREKAAADKAQSQEEQPEEEQQKQPRKRAPAGGGRKRKAKLSDDSDDKENFSDDDVGTRRATNPKKSRAKSSRASKPVVVDSDDSEEVVASAPSRSRPRRRAANSQAKYNYGSDSDNGDDESDAVVDPVEDDDEELDDVEEEEVVKPKKRGRAATKKPPAKRKTPAKQTKLSFSQNNRGTKSSSRAMSNRRRANPDNDYEEDDSDDNVGSRRANSLGLAHGWGTAPTQSMK